MHFALLLALVCVAMVGMLVVAGPERTVSWAKPGGAVRYSLRSLMTAREREFIRLLRLALPDAEIHAQVAMGRWSRSSVAAGPRVIVLIGRFWIT